MEVLIVAIVVALIGICGKILVERYKSKQSFKNELRSESVVKINEVWEALNIYEADIDNIIRKILPIKLENFGDKEVLKNKLSEKNILNLLKKDRELYEEVKGKAIRGQFLLGKKRYESIIDYNRFLIEYMDAVVSAEDLEKINELNKKRKQDKVNIDKLRDELLNK